MMGIIHYTNALFGAVLALPLLFKFAPKLKDFYQNLKSKWKIMGMISLCIGILNLLDRILGELNIPFGIPLMDGSIPQTLAALAIGIIMAFEVVKQYSFLRKLGAVLIQFSQIVGVVAILAAVWVYIPYV